MEKDWTVDGDPEQTRYPALFDFLERERATAMLAWPHIMPALANDPSFAALDRLLSRAPPAQPAASETIACPTFKLVAGDYLFDSDAIVAR